MQPFLNNETRRRLLVAVFTVCTAASVLLSTGATAAQRFTSRIFATGLQEPQAVVPLSDDSALIAQRNGRLLLLAGGVRTDLGLVSAENATLFFVPGRPFTEGLKELVKIPEQPDHYLWCMTSGDEKAVRWTVGQAHLTVKKGAAPAMANQVVWQSEPQPWTRSDPPPFSGCKIAFDGPDVVVALGANGRANQSGRIVRFPLANPKASRVVSTGHRNPGGLVFLSGVLWEVEHGPKGGDELNAIVQGADYGWPAISSGTPDDAFHQTFAKSGAGKVDPLFAWTPAIAPSSLAAWRGRLYVGALQQPGVIEVEVTGNQVVSHSRVIESARRVRDVRAAENGAFLWVMTDGADAQLLQFWPQQTDTAVGK